MKETTLEQIRSANSKSRKGIEKIVELKNLIKKFGNETVVDDVNLNIRKGEFVTILGPSGCGKTTILRMIAGFETPTSGTILLEGKDVTSVPPHKRNVNTVFQKYALFPHLNVFNNIAFGLKLKNIPCGEGEKPKNKKNNTRKLTKKEIGEKVNGALKLVGLDDFGHRDVDSLSGGQQQRIAIARALVNEPKVLLLDEPLGALDLKMRKEMQTELRRMHRELGVTFIYVTHDQEEALTMSDTVVVMTDGKIQQVGTPKEIYDEPANAFVADFIGESNILPGVILEDFKVKFLGKIFTCADKGFDKNELIDVVIRPEDINILKTDDSRAQLKGTVISSVFKGTYYEKIILSEGYEFSVQNMQEWTVGTEVGLEFKPDSIHIMEQEESINKYETHMLSGHTVEIGGEAFEIIADAGQFEKGDLVTAYIEFDKVELTDDEKDGVVGGSVGSSIYKGRYYNVKVWMDNDTPMIINTTAEWDLNDRVGIVIKPEDIRIERLEARVENDGEE